MKFTQHEQKIVDIVSQHPGILNNPTLRRKIAEKYELSEKTLRNRIAELKKMGIIKGETITNYPKFNQTGTIIDLDIVSLWKIIYSKRNFIIKWTCFTTLVFLIYSFMTTPLFESSTTLYPARSLSESNKNSLQNIAEKFGIGGVNEGQTFNIPDIIYSQRLKKEIVLNQWDSPSCSTKVNLIQYWEIDKTKWHQLTKHLSQFFPLSQDEQKLQKKYLYAATEKLAEFISVDETESGLIKISVLMEEAKLAADIANYTSEFVKIFISNEQGIEAIKNRNFISTQLANLKFELDKSENELTKFKEENPISSVPALEEQRRRLERDIESNLQVFIMLRQQFELAKIEVAKEPLLITILDKAEAPVLKSRPQRKLIVIGGFILGFFLSTMWTFFSAVIQLNKT